MRQRNELLYDSHHFSFNHSDDYTHDDDDGDDDDDDDEDGDDDDDDNDNGDDDDDEYKSYNRHLKRIVPRCLTCVHHN